MRGRDTLNCHECHPFILQFAFVLKGFQISSNAPGVEVLVLNSN